MCLGVVYNRRSVKCWERMVAGLCENCKYLIAMFEAARLSPHFSYLHMLSLLESQEKNRWILLEAGDCPTSEAVRCLEAERHYTIRHYFKCVTCFRYFYIGACIRGTPVYQVLDDLEQENLERVLWGRTGYRFRNY